MFAASFCGSCSDKKENQIFPINKEIQNGAVQYHVTNGLLVYG
jgi:hypothetical protein